MEKVKYVSCVAIEKISKDEWKFKCLDNGKFYSNNLSLAMDENIPVEVGTEFKLSELALDSSDRV